jgi:hypothetical protein
LAPISLEVLLFAAGDHLSECRTDASSFDADPG